MRNRILLAVLIVVNVISIGYFGFYASPVYVSESRFVVDNPGKGGDKGGLSSLLTGQGAFSLGGSLIVKEYLSSHRAIEELSSSVTLKSIYAKGDVMGRLGGAIWRRTDNVSLWNYVERHVEDRVNAKDGASRLRVFAYTAHDAATINNTLLNAAQAFLDRLNAKEVTEETAVGRRIAKTARQRLDRDEDELTRLRNQSHSYDPKAQNEADVAMLSEIEEGILKDRAGLNALKRTAPGNPNIPTLEKSLSERQAIWSQRQLATSGNNGSLASRSTLIERLTVTEKIDISSLKAAELELQTLSAESQNRKFVLSVISGPNVPEIPQRPMRVLIIIGVALASLLVWSFGRRVPVA